MTVCNTHTLCMPSNSLEQDRMAPARFWHIKWSSPSFSPSSSSDDERPGAWDVHTAGNTLGNTVYWIHCALRLLWRNQKKRAWMASRERQLKCPNHQKKENHSDSKQLVHLLVRKRATAYEIGRLNYEVALSLSKSFRFWEFKFGGECSESVSCSWTCGHFLRLPKILGIVQGSSEGRNQERT